MSYKRPFSAMERDSLFGSAEHDDSVWIPRKDRYREIDREVPYVTPVRKAILTEELSQRYPLFKTNTFGQKSREMAVNYILHNNEHYGLKPFAVPKTVDCMLRENSQFKCKLAQNYFSNYDQNRLNDIYTWDSFSLVNNCPMQEPEPQPACAGILFYSKRPCSAQRPSSAAPARRASVLPTWIWTVLKLVLFALFVVSVVYGFLIVYQDVPDVWHSQVPRLLFGQKAWRLYYVDLWMGMAAYYCRYSYVAAGRFRSFHLANVEDYNNPHQLENRFTATFWMCKSYIQAGAFLDIDYYCQEPVLLMGYTDNLPVYVKYDCLYNSAIGLVHKAEKMKSVKYMNIAHQWVIQTETLLGYYTAEAQDLLEQSDPFQFQSRLNKMNEERIRKKTEEKKRHEEQKKAYEDMNERFRKENEEERIQDEKRKEYWRQQWKKQDEKRSEYWRQQWKKQEERFANSQRVPSDSTKKTHWQVLGLEPGATAAEIKKAYRQKSLETHPDKVCGAGKCKSEQEQREATEKFREVVAAFEALSRAHTCS